jgi:hypothetical protein
MNRGLMLVMLLVAALAGAHQNALAQVPMTTVQDTVYRADGTAASGTVVVSWNAFTTAGGNAIAAGTSSATLGASGTLSIALTPNASSTPMGSYYTADFHLDDGTINRQYWVIPTEPAGTTVNLAAIESQVLPTSVAMQTVSKAYVDAAIANATGTTTTTTTGDYVLKTGDTMTGPLLLPADPVSSKQAADKNYVDTNIAAIAAGVGQKVSLLPTATQTVAQPAGTQLEVNNLNGELYASQYQNDSGGNGIANALASPDCASGCELKAEQNYASGEPVNVASIPASGHLVDARGGAEAHTFVDPEGPTAVGSTAESINELTTRTALSFKALRPSTVGLNSYALSLSNTAFTGGTNLYPGNIEASIPYNKSTYGVSTSTGNYYTQGQHVQTTNNVNCYSVGDCLAGSQYITTSGGYRDPADEGTHPFDLQVNEDSGTFVGTCTTGCAAGSTALFVNATAGGGHQGDGRFLIDKNPSKVVTTGSVVSSGRDLFGIAYLSGTSLPLGVLLTTTSAATSQPANIAPGTVTLPIATTAAHAGFSTSTSALPSSGVACVADPIHNGQEFPNYEMANYTVVDSTHLSLTLNKAHASGAVISVGGLCGYGLEQTVDTVGAVRQVFPVIGAFNSTSLYYADSFTPVIGNGNSVSTSGFANVSVPVTSVARQNNTVTVTLASAMPEDLNGLTLTLSGVSDASYNGSFAMQTTSSTTLTFAQTGANSTSSGGTLSLLTGAYVLYPMAEVLSVFNPANRSVDGTLALAPNTVAWASGDVVEEPHYYQQYIYPDTEFITQWVPRPIEYVSAGKQYQGEVGPGLRGWQIANAVSSSNYIGGGGTRQVPDDAMLVTGVWNNSLEATAGVQNLIHVHCNLHGCNRWDSGYSLLDMDSSVGQDFLYYSPQSSTASWNLRGTSFSFSPNGFSANTINAGTVNATAAILSTVAANDTGCTDCIALAASSAGTTATDITLDNSSPGAHNYTFFSTGSANGPGYFGVYDSTAGVGPLGVHGISSGVGLVVFGSGTVAGWSNQGNAFNGAMDTGLSRESADMVDCGNGTAKDASCTFKANRMYVSGVRSGTAANTDISGTLTLAAGATSSASYSFSGGYSSPPVCMVQTQNATAAQVAALGAMAPQVSATGLSVSVQTAPASAVTLGYECVGRN